MTTETTEQYFPGRNSFGHSQYLSDLARCNDGYRFLDRIDFFDETPEGDFLSNFYPSPIRLDLGHGPILYPTGEHAFQAAKATTEAEHRVIAEAATPGSAKYLGRTTPLRQGWEQVKEAVMEDVLAAKFPADAEHPLTARLLATGHQMLIEGTNWNDKVWGVAFDRRVLRMEGRNLLGALLMERRGALRAQFWSTR